MADIVLCCDGTWNTPEDTENGLPSVTNVCKIYNAINVSAQTGRQVTYYHPGVGTSGGMADRLLGGGAGAGLGRNVKSGYKWLAVNYRKGDRIWLFGFSRGAFTARCIAGMVTRYGLRDLSDTMLSEDAVWSAVDQVFQKYRDADPHRGTGPFHNDDTGGITPVHFIGVWDTVGSLGVPDDVAFLDLLDDPRNYQFHDTDLNDNVIHARHALALDEMRQSFIPTLWTGLDKRPQNTSVQQLWFPGVHSDVGGGYGDSALSDIALEWMIDEAKAEGLTFHTGISTQINPNPIGYLHDSCSGVFKLLPTRPRNVPAIIKANTHTKAKPGVVHASVIQRVDGRSLFQANYREHKVVLPGNPVTSEIFAAKHWNPTGIFLEKGVSYTLKASGQWLDSSLRAGPDGTEDGKFEAGEIAHLVSKGIGLMENAYRGIFNTPKTEFAGTLRHGNSGFFALIGMIANGAGLERDWWQQQFVIGRGTTVTPNESGYLYCFANDVWLAYDNNHGSVQLMVSM